MNTPNDNNIHAQSPGATATEKASQGEKIFKHVRFTIGLVTSRLM